MEPPVLWDATVDAQKMMSTIYRTQQMYGAGHIIDVIRGSKSTKISDRRHDTLSVFGIGKDMPKEHWNSVLRQLLNLNFIFIKSWEYRSLGLNQKSLEILTGGAKLQLRKQEFSVISKKGKKESSKTKEVSHDRDDLFESLKRLRNKLAKEKHLPSYIVFNDKSLHDMCSLMPRNNDEFLMVHGVGQNKLENYGKFFLELINRE